MSETTLAAFIAISGMLQILSFCAGFLAGRREFDSIAKHEAPKAHGRD